MKTLYDFNNPNERAVAARDLIDLIIHSFAFSESLREDMTVEGFLVTSDMRRYDWLWFVEMKAFIALMRQVGTDYPSSMSGVFNRKKNDWEMWRAIASATPRLAFTSLCIHPWVDACTRPQTSGRRT